MIPTIDSGSCTWLTEGKPNVAFKVKQKKHGDGQKTEKYIIRIRQGKARHTAIHTEILGHYVWNICMVTF